MTTRPGTQTVIRGHKVGAVPSAEHETARSSFAARVLVSYWCEAKHTTTCTFAAGAKAPASWVCPKCGRPSYRDPGQVPPPGERELRQREHLGRVKERRTEADGQALIEWAADRLHTARAQQARRRVTHTAEEEVTRQDASLCGPVAMATFPAPEPVAASSHVIRRQPRRRSRAARRANR